MQHSHTGSTQSAPMDVSSVTRTQERLAFESGPQVSLVELVSQNNMGVVHMEASNYEKALDCFHKSLSQVDGSMALQCQLPTNLLAERYSSSLKESGSVASKNGYLYQRGNYDEGMHVYTQPIQIDQKLASLFAYQDALIRVLYNKGLAHLELDEDELASEAFFHALSLCHWRSQDKSSLGKAMSIIAILHNIGYIQYRGSRHEEAMRTFEEALDLGREVYSPHSLEVAATMNCLGILHFHMPKSETEIALDFYHQCLSIQQAILGSDHRDVATTLNNIGRVNYMKCEYDEALANYSEALRVRRLVLGEHDLDVAATIYNAGQTYHQKGDLGRALQLYQDFITIALAKLGKDHRDIAIIYKCMAQIFQERREYDHSLALYREALRSGRAALGNLHPEIASILNKMGNLYYEKGDFDSAIAMYEEGLEVERAVLHRLHPNITVTVSIIQSREVGSKRKTVTLTNHLVVLCVLSSQTLGRSTSIVVTLNRRCVFTTRPLLFSVSL